MIIKFTTAQAESCLYPIGCPVWIFSHDPQYDDISKSSSFKRGKVDSVSMDFISKQLMYTVNIGENGSICVPEEDLRFGAGCPVNVVPKDRESGGEEEVLAGSVLMSKRTNDTILYTVNYGQRFEDNILACRVAYRKEMGSAVIISQPEPKEQAAADDDKKCPRAKNDEQEPDLVFPASINLRDDSKLSDTTLSVSAKTGDGTITSIISRSNKRQKVGSKQNSMNSSRQTSKGIRITLPFCLQQDFASQRNLFFYLLRGQHGCGQGAVSLIRKETNCRVRINYDEFNEKQGMPNEMITIDIDHCKYHCASSRIFIDARRIIEDAIMNFWLPGLPPIKEDGSKGRMLYEIAASCKGPHRPKDSASNAVMQLNPFDIYNKQCFMSILELPRTVNKLNTIFHGHFLADSATITKISNLTGCTYKLVGGDFGSPAVRYCNPYLIVFGKHWTKVDHAVEILKHQIHMHRHNCACSYG